MFLIIAELVRLRHAKRCLRKSDVSLTFYNAVVLVRALIFFTLIILFSMHYIYFLHKINHKPSFIFHWKTIQHHQKTTGQTQFFPQFCEEL